MLQWLRTIVLQRFANEEISMSNKMNLPWVVFPINRSRASILDERGAYIVENVFTDTAAHIVRCVNAHDALVEALTIFVQHFSDPFQYARAALAKAQGDQDGTR